MIEFEHLRTVSLAHNGECGLLGVDADMNFYVEEIYGDEGWMAQAAYDLDGQELAAVDERAGDNQGVERLQKPRGLIRPGTGMSTTRLNFGGARHQGLVEEDRVEDMVRPLSIEDKMLLVEEGFIPSVAPPAVLGLAQSYVVSEAQVKETERSGRKQSPLFLLSRRLRVAYRLAGPARDELGNPYDYTSHEVAVMQQHRPGDEFAPLGETVLDQKVLGVALNWPTDLVLRDDILFVADAAHEVDGLTSRVHIWRVSVPSSKLPRGEAYREDWEYRAD